ncbi:hypothetical protein KI387_041693, partial [Taxus chinensis]
GATGSQDGSLGSGAGCRERAKGGGLWECGLVRARLGAQEGEVMLGKAKRVDRFRNGDRFGVGIGT